MVAVSARQRLWLLRVRFEAHGAFVNALAVRGMRASRAGCAGCEHGQHWAQPARRRYNPITAAGCTILASSATLTSFAALRELRWLRWLRCAPPSLLCRACAVTAASASATTAPAAIIAALLKVTLPAKHWVVPGTPHDAVRSHGLAFSAADCPDPSI